MGNSGAITLDTIVVRNDKKFITSPIGDEIVMMSMESGNYIGMNKVGTVIWEHLEKPTKVQDLVDYLLYIYDIDAEECALKTIKHLDHMRKEQMLTVLAA